MAEMSDSERLIWQQTEKIRQLEASLGLAMRTLSDEILVMQAATIAERLKPGSGMEWITESLTDALTYPSQDAAWGPLWDGKQTALEWFEAQKQAERTPTTDTKEPK